MKPHLPAGHEGDDLKTLQREIAKLETLIGNHHDAEADKILKESGKEVSTSVPTLQGGRPESNRRKF